MKKYKVGIIGATGMVGQRFMLLLENHPWFDVVVLAASSRSAGKPYVEAVGQKWNMTKEIPEKYRDMIVCDAQADVKKIAETVDFVFCAVDMKKDEIKALEEMYAKNECPVISNNSANRFTPDVPMIVPEIIQLRFCHCGAVVVPVGSDGVTGETLGAVKMVMIGDCFCITVEQSHRIVSGKADDALGKDVFGCRAVCRVIFGNCAQPGHAPLESAEMDIQIQKSAEQTAFPIAQNNCRISDESGSVSGKLLAAGNFRNR